MRFESWIYFQNESLLIKIMSEMFIEVQPRSNRGPPAFQTMSLPSELSMLSIHRLKMDRLCANI